MPTINISTLKLTINVQAHATEAEADETSTRPFAALAALLEAAQQPAESQQAPGVVTPAQVVDFLQSDPRYSWRTAQAMAKHFGLSESDAEQLLGDAVAHDKAEMCHRRADDVKLYRAL